MKCVMHWRRKFQLMGLVMAGVVSGTMTGAMAIETKPSGDTCRDKPVCKPETQAAEEIPPPAPEAPAPPAEPAPEVPSEEPQPQGEVTPAAPMPQAAAPAIEGVTVTQVAQSSAPVQVQVDLHVNQTVVQQVTEIAVLEALTEPVRGRVVKCETELEEARRALGEAVEAAARSRDIAARRLRVIVQLRDLFASDRCEIEWKGESFSRESVGEALRHQISLYRLEREESLRRDEIEATRRIQLEAVEARVLKWRREEEELVRMVEVLRAEAAAAEAAGDAAAIPATTRDQATALSERIEEMLGVAAPPLEDADRRLLDEADSLIQGTTDGIAATSPAQEGSE